MVSSYRLSFVSRKKICSQPGKASSGGSLLLLLRNSTPEFPRSVLGRDEMESQGACLLFQSFFDVLGVPRFVFGEDAFIVSLPSCQEVIDDASEFMGRSGDRLWRPQFGAHAAIVLAKGAVAVVQGVRSKTKSFGSTVFRLSSTSP